MNFIISPDFYNPNYVKALVKDKSSCIEKQNWNSFVANSGHCVIYHIFKYSLQLEEYLTFLIQKGAIDFCRFRCDNHKLPAVIDMFSNTERCNYVFTLCNLNMNADYYYIPVNGNTALLSSYRGCSKDKIRPTLVLRPSTKLSLLLFRQF